MTGRIPWPGLALLAALVLVAAAPWVVPGCHAIVGFDPGRLGLAAGTSDTVLVQTHWSVPWSPAAPSSRLAGACLPGLAWALQTVRTLPAEVPLPVACLALVSILLGGRFLLMACAGTALGCMGAAAGLVGLLVAPALVGRDAGPIWWPTWGVRLAMVGGCCLGLVGWWAVRRSPGWDVRLGAVVLGALVLAGCPSVLGWSWWPMLGIGILMPRVALVVWSAVLFCRIEGWPGIAPVLVTAAAYGALLAIAIPSVREDVRALCARRWADVR